MAKVNFNEATTDTAPVTPGEVFPGEDAADPFQQESTPAVSFRDAQVGSTVTGIVVKAAQLVQSRVFETGALATWPDGNPKMSAVVALSIDGELKSLWAPKPSAMFAAIGAETKRIGRGLKPGDTVEVTLSGTKPNTRNPKLNPQKLYTVKVTPGS